MIPRAWMISAAAVSIVAAGIVGYRQGVAVTEARMFRAQHEAQQAAYRAAELASRKEAERLAAEAERADLARQLEDQAYAEVATGTCLPVSRVLRLNQR